VRLRIAFSVATAAAALSFAADPGLARLEREMARLAEVSAGVVGAAAIHVETGRQAVLNPAARFPMASTFKVPVAVTLLHRVDQGEERLDRMITLKPSDLHPGSGTLTFLFNKPGVALSVRNLLELMLLISDNSAADLCLRLAGGPEAVNARLRQLGIEGVEVDRPTALLIADVVGADHLPPEAEWSPETFQKIFKTVPPEQRKEAQRKFDADPRDTATPAGMAKLLEHIYRKDLLKPETAELLLDIMRRCQTGEGRLKGLLPAGTEVAHKTGTIGMSVDDVGIMTLPDGGHVVLAVFVKSSEKDEKSRERAIAEIARAVFDYFLFNPN
jgi:beta-lactamase class A